jgi:hypothetical protein
MFRFPWIGDVDQESNHPLVEERAQQTYVTSSSLFFLRASFFTY